MSLIESTAWMQLVDTFVIIRITCPSAQAAFWVNQSQVAPITFLIDYKDSKFYTLRSQYDFSASHNDGFKTTHVAALNFNQLQIEVVDVELKFLNQKFLMPLKIFPTLLKVDLRFDRLSGKCLKPDLALSPLIKNKT